MTVPSQADINKRRGGQSPSLKVGDTFQHDLYGEYKVTNYVNAHNVTILFTKTGYESVVSTSEISRNEVRDHTQVRTYGVGINDAGYVVIEKTRKGRGSGNKTKCPFWTKWVSMLERCYSKQMSKSYANTRVCEEWLTFSKFKAWMETQDWEGKHLDKDLLGDGSYYSPETCCFLSKEVNGFLVGCNKPFSSKVGKSGKYQARCMNPFSEDKEDGRYLGLFKTPEEAYAAWKAKKDEYACLLAVLEEDPRVAEGLRRKFK